ncbi:hypothetical protein BDV10DRAFT_163809 [Aspergillus recurvatus]
MGPVISLPSLPSPQSRARPASDSAICFPLIARPIRALQQPRGAAMCPATPAPTPTAPGADTPAPATAKTLQQPAVHVPQKQQPTTRSPAPARPATQPSPPPSPAAR